MSTTDWNTSDTSSFIHLPTHSLFLHAMTPPKPTPGSPAIIIEHGLGGSALEWLPAMRQIATFARVYAYERAGYHPSTLSPEPRTPSHIAVDLKSLLSTANITPPYILVGHSYGGVLVRQFLADFGPDSLAGMVIVDSAPEPTKIPEGWNTLLGDSTYDQVVGIEDGHVHSAEEYAELKECCAKNEAEGGIADQEIKLQHETKILNERLRGKQALGAKPLSMIMCDEANDMRKVYEYGLKHGNGSVEAQEALRKRLEDMSEVDEAAMRTHLTLSSNSRFVKAEGKAQTHNSHVMDPSLVVGEIKWVLRQHELMDEE